MSIQPTTLTLELVAIPNDIVAPTLGTLTT